ncbi:tRNA pseudouridine(55) synthase TruB [Longispora urticae]
MATTGLVIVDKPAGMTSHDVVARVRRLARTRRVGHGGTLDPMATGVLVLGVERGTKLLTYVIGSRKGYTGTIRLGQSTITDDAEGEFVTEVPADDVTDEAIRAGLATMVGLIQQVPSSVSAIKIKGVRSYSRVRAGEDVELPSRPITIHRLDVGSIRRSPGLVDVDVSVECSSGTYIRAIARDLGVLTGVGGHLTALRRTAVGGFTLAEARTLDELAELDDPVNLDLNTSAARLFPRRDLDELEAKVISHGGPLSPVGIEVPYAVYGPSGDVLAIMVEKAGRAKPELVLAPA